MHSVPLTALLALAACSGATDAGSNGVTAESLPGDSAPQAIVPSPPPEPTPTPTPKAVATAASTMGGDGSTLALARLTPADSQGLDGELGCSFALHQGEVPILVGMADVGADARADAVIRIGDYPERLVSRGTGGFGAMERGTSFAGRGMTVTIDPGEQVVGGEAPTRRATLLAQRADGAERTFDGLWTCGP